MSGIGKLKADALLLAIADCAVELLRVPHVERSMPKILETLGKATRVDRMHLVEVARKAHGGPAVIERHASWCAPSIPLSAGLAAFLGHSLAERGFGSWAERFDNGEIVSGTVESFEPHIRDFLSRDGVKSLIVVPVFVDGRWWGQIGFDDCTAVRHWSASEIAALRTLAGLIGAAVQRSQDMAQLASANRIVESSPTILFRLGPRPPYPLEYISQNVARYGYTAAELLARPTRWSEIIEQEDMAALAGAIESVGEERAESAQAEFRLITPSGDRVWFDGHSAAHREDDLGILAIEGLITDISERKRAQRRIERLAHFDSVTGLANRACFLEKLAAACAGPARSLFAVYFIDLDKFKDVNDTLGHAVGDLLLRTVAHRLRSSVRKTDTVARFGGDEFAILQPNLKSSHAAARFAEKICDAISMPYRISGHDISISVSVGVDSARGGSVNPDTIMARADQALYRAKQEGRNCVRIFDPEFRSIIGTALASNLRRLPAA